MILTTLAEADACAELAPGLAAGPAWLRAFDPATPDGRHEGGGTKKREDRAASALVLP